MTKSKNPNPIEEAIGERAEDPKALEEFTKEYQAEPTPKTSSQVLRDAPDQPLTQNEMLSLEELNHKAVERLGDKYPEDQVEVSHTVPKVPTLPVSQPDPPPVTETSSPESPPQKIDEIDEYQDAEKRPTMAESLGRKMNEAQDDHQKHVERYNKTAEKIGIPKTEIHPVATPIPNIEKLPSDFKVKHTYETGVAGCASAEDVELTALRKYILEDGFVLATVAFHIVSLCAQPMTTPSTTMWDFKDRAFIPDMVLVLLNQPGYLEGIWPSLKIVMSSNAGNPAWCAGIATTIAFFDVIRTLPALKELKNEEKS